MCTIRFFCSYIIALLIGGIEAFTVIHMYKRNLLMSFCFYEMLHLANWLLSNTSWLSSVAVSSHMQRSWSQWPINLGHIINKELLNSWFYTTHACIRTKSWMRITSFVELLLTKEDLAKQNTVVVTNQFITINGILSDNGQ